MSASTLDSRPVKALPMPPAPPSTIKETGLHPDTLSQLLLKTLVAGEASGSGLAESLRLPYSLLEALVEHARVEKLVEVRGASGTGSAGYRYVLTDLGRDRAYQFFEMSRYVGPAPVPLGQYNAYVRACMAARPYVDREQLATGFRDLIVNDSMFERLGPAVNSGKSLFLYGAPGNGKTVVAEGIGRALGEEMHIPHALDVDGQTITMFDPVNHHHLKGAEASSSVITTASYDRRWECIRRPVVVVGGELTLEMLDLTFNPIAKFYEAPIQLKANGGVFVVDDFGRQRIPPRDLLNRWIVPLESRVDFLTLHTGRKFETPFNVLIVFATNLKPESLADEAFLRRIPYKILAKNPTVDEVLPHFRIELQEARALVRSGDGRVSEPEVLHAPQAANARVPSARPRRAGRRHVPVSGKDASPLARAARRGVPQLLPRGIRLAGGRAAMKRGAVALSVPAEMAAGAGTLGVELQLPHREPEQTAATGAQRRDIADSAARTVVIALFTVMAVRLGMDFMQTGRITGLLLLASEALVVVLTVFRRVPALVDRTARARVLTAVSMLGPPLVRPTGVEGIAPEIATVAVSAAGLLLVITGKLSLGRSFGLMPANRGIVSTGLYRLVRHPIYLGYLITHYAFVAANASMWNVILLVTADLALMVRAVCEERILARDPEYRAYQQIVRWRIVPGVF